MFISRSLPPDAKRGMEVGSSTRVSFVFEVKLSDNTSPSCASCQHSCKTFRFWHVNGYHCLYSYTFKIWNIFETSLLVYWRYKKVLITSQPTAHKWHLWVHEDAHYPTHTHAKLKHSFRSLEIPNWLCVKRHALWRLLAATYSGHRHEDFHFDHQQLDADRQD